jgi:hypothetical protein
MNLFMRRALTLAPALTLIALGLERVSNLPGNVCLTCSDGLLLGSRIPLAPPPSLAVAAISGEQREMAPGAQNRGMRQDLSAIDFLCSDGPNLSSVSVHQRSP